MAIKTPGNASSGAHMHLSNSSSAPLSFGQYLKQEAVLEVMGDGMHSIRLLVDELDYKTASAAGGTAHMVSAKLSSGEMNRLMGGGAEMVQFMRDQMDNYEDAFSKDFTAGFRTAIEVLMGKQTLEDLLPEDY